MVSAMAAPRHSAGMIALTIVSISSATSARPVGEAVNVAHGPYLQSLGPTAVTVKLELASPGTAAVDVVPAGGGPVAAHGESAEALSFHVLRVDGLSPATAYDYRLSVGGAAVPLGGTPSPPGEVGHFTTAPADARPFRFLAYGDSRSNPQAHAAVCRAMEAAPGDFLVNTGDMVSMGNRPEDWSELFSIEGRLLRDRCVFVAVGNHELARGDPAGVAAFLRYFGAGGEGKMPGRLYDTFRWSNTRFFLLNAMDDWTGDERAWLRAELDRARSEPGLAHRIAVMHWGPFSSGRHGNNPALANGEVVAMMRERGVDLLIAGHDHAYERGSGGGLKYVITGGAGAPLYEKKFDAGETLRFESAHHFLEIAVDGDRVTSIARRPSGAVLETCGFLGDGPWDCDPPAPDPSPGAPSRARAACGCALPGAPAGGAGATLVLVATLALRRRRRSPPRSAVSASLSS
jgi:MYXO-CTERM domain-containing protein